MSDGEDSPTKPSSEDYEIVAEGEEWPETFERPRGIYTDVDRQFLWGVKEYDSRVTTSERRGGIRDRTVEGLRDLSYLRFLDDGQREDVIENIKAAAPEGELRESVSALIEFLYRGMDGDEGWLEEAIAHGIERAEAERDKVDRYGMSTVDVDIEVAHGHNLDRLKRTVEDGKAHTLTPAEVGALVRSGRVDADDLQELQAGLGGENSTTGSGYPFFDEMMVDEDADYE